LRARNRGQELQHLSESYNIITRINASASGGIFCRSTKKLAHPNIIWDSPTSAWRASLSATDEGVPALFFENCAHRPNRNAAEYVLDSVF
jgi:hypothetical protein